MHSQCRSSKSYSGDRASLYSKLLQDSYFLRNVLYLSGIITLRCVVRKFGYLQNKGTSLWKFVLDSGLRKYRHSISVVEARYQLSSAKVQSVINWTVVGQLS